MIALFALTIALAANGLSPSIIPSEFRGQWHAGNAPCDEAAPGHVDIFDRALTLESKGDGSDDEIEFGVRSIRKISDREMVAVGNWRENTIDNQNSSLRFTLSYDRHWLTLRLSGWQKRYACCPKGS